MPPFSKPYYFPTGLQFSNSRLLLKAYKTVSQEQYPGEPEAERRDENSTLEEFESSGTAGSNIFANSWKWPKMSILTLQYRRLSFQESFFEFLENTLCALLCCSTMSAKSAISKEIFAPLDERMLGAVQVKRRTKKKIPFLATGGQGEYLTYICLSERRKTRLTKIIQLAYQVATTEKWSLFGTGSVCLSQKPDLLRSKPSSALCLLCSQQYIPQARFLDLIFVCIVSVVTACALPLITKLVFPFPRNK
ncbi:syntaxin-binding protein 6 isoform X3 [Canis lupus baileyi]|uniref:syntaxin-binding protein 6 isoform X3 n=1 Tax=Canis lupus baileyi TaxID=143281 RepID=UPI003B97588F